MERFLSLSPDKIQSFKDIISDTDLLNDWEIQLEVYGEEEFAEWVEEDERLDQFFIDQLKHKFREYIKDCATRNPYKMNSWIVNFGTDLIYIYDTKSEEFEHIGQDDYINDPERFIGEYFPDFDTDELHLSGIDTKYGDLKNNPEGTYYHYTTEDKWESIQEEGGMRSSWGTGLDNRNNFGIFTSIDPETYADGTYGDVLLEIDMTSYLKDGHKATATIEEPVLEYYLTEFISCVLDRENCGYVSSDYSEQTVIIEPEYELLPLKYIKRID